MVLYYFDTCIWIDFFENRTEYGLEKGKIVEELITKIINNDDNILYAALICDEMRALNYTVFEIEKLFEPFCKILVFSEETKKQFGKAKDLSAKRNVPLCDALHAIIARDNHAIFVSRDKHFRILQDIIIAKKPEELI